MKYHVAAVLAALFALPPAFAQAPPAPTPPVEETEAPEDKAIDPEREPDPLPAPAPVPVPAPAPPIAIVPAPPAPPAVAAAEAKPPKWDVNAPPGAIIRQVPIAVDEGSWMD